MKLLAFVLLASYFVVGDGFYQPFSPIFKSPAYSPFLPNRPVRGLYYYSPNRPNNWAQYYFQDDYYTPIALPDPSPQGVFSVGQQRSASAKKDDVDQSVESWQANPIEPKVSFSRQRFPSWNHKFFLLDNEAQTVHALRPFNPLELFSLHVNQQIQPSVPLTRPIFARQTVRISATEIVKVTSTKICVSSSCFINPSNPTVCPTFNRTRRFIDSDDDLLEDFVSPTIVNHEDLVRPTMLIGDNRPSPVYEIESTKDEDHLDGRLEFNYYGLPGMKRKDRAMFNRIPSTSTVIIVTSETYFVTKAVNPVSSVPGQPGALLCVPPGIVVCA